MSRPFQVKNKDGSLKYGGQWLIAYKVPGESKRRVHIGGSTEKEAREALQTILADMRRGIWVDPRAQREAARSDTRSLL